MGFLRWNVLFLVAVLQQQIDRSSQQLTPPSLNCPPNSSAAWITDCDLTCATVDYRQDCDSTMKPGCRCNQGLYAQTGTSGESVNCVEPKYCKVKCGPNKYYDPQANGCQPTCEWPDLPKYCKAPQRPTCVCKKKYMLSETYNKACIKCNNPTIKSY
ncbi:zonadhesin-like isoform X2 [Eleutherodactylus coqui]|uniref:zonadhesin-like isoform X2 n=1 Tax=Eleutherodactylus coqui TaxID=57060 RepID=UPI0034618532